MPSTPHIVYVLRDYPSLSQTFVRNEVVSLRERGLDVSVMALRPSTSTHVPTGWGGASRVVERSSRLRGVWDTLLVAVRHPLRLVAMWKQVRATGQAERWSAAYLVPGAARSLSPKAADACHTHFAFENAYPALYLARLLGVPASITVHAADIYRDPAKAVALLQHFDTVITVCQYNVDLLRDRGLTRPRLEIVPCGVDVPPPPPDTRAEHPTVVSVGRFVPKKGFPVLVRAWAQVVDSVPDARLILVGDGPEREAVAAQVAELELGDRVVFLGARPHDEVLDIIAGSDLFALACDVPPDGDSDALPVVIREAMVRARPVVSTTVAGVPEAVGPDGGWLVGAGDADGLATSILAAFDDPAEAARRGRAGRARVMSEATLERSALMLQEILTPQSVHGARGRR